jgi:hypothetical protein
MFMWICLPEAFLSIVHKDCGPDELLVRARVAGHIEAVFPHVKVSQSQFSDYRYRAVVSRDDVAAALVMHANAMDYPNFKNEVRENRLHDAFARIWSVMAGLQPTPPHHGHSRKRQNRLI